MSVVADAVMTLSLNNWMLTNGMASEFVESTTLPEMEDVAGGVFLVC